MKQNIKKIILIMLILLAIVSSSILIFAQGQVSINLNGDKVIFPDAKPYMDTRAGRVLVPARFVAESLDALVRWDPINRQVDIMKDETHIKFKLGERKFMLNNIEKPMDTTIFIKEDRAFVPLRLISESFNIDVGWDEETNTVLLKERTNNKEFIIQDIYLGETKEELISKLGEPNRKDLSEYGFQWYVYNKDYSKYIQVGVKDNKVVAIYTNTDNWKSTKGISIGMTRANVEKLLGKPLKSILKGNTNYIISNENEKTIYLIDDSYVSIFYDIHNKNTVTSVQIIDKDMELGLNGYYGQYNEALRDSFERQMFDIANAIRVRNGLKPFTWSDKAKISSRKHSEDMANNNYFAHTNLKKESPFHRMEKEGITYTQAAENIAAGTPNAIAAHEGLMNSMGHRVNILGECKTLGVGVGYNSNTQYKYYYTQNFFTGR